MCSNHPEKPGVLASCTEVVCRNLLRKEKNLTFYIKKADRSKQSNINRIIHHRNKEPRALCRDLVISCFLHATLIIHIFTQSKGKPLGCVQTNISLFIWMRAKHWHSGALQGPLAEQRRIIPLKSWILYLTMWRHLARHCHTYMQSNIPGGLLCNMNSNMNCFGCLPQGRCSKR